MKDIRKFLPIGSVVVLKNGTKRLMIFGIIQSNAENPAEEYDYIGVPYPEGNMGQDYQYLFYHNDIEKVYFKGFEDVERQEFIDNLEEFYKNQFNQ